MIVITGFAALTIDAGLGYRQSRDDQNVADAAALTAAYWISQGSSLSNATAAAQSVLKIDGCTSPCALWNSLTSTNVPIYFEGGALFTAISSGTAITSISLSSLSASLSTGTVLSVGNFGEQVTLSAAATASTGAVTLSVNSWTPQHPYPVSAPVKYAPTAQSSMTSSQVAFVGATLTDTGNAYFSAGSHHYTIGTLAVAQVSSAAGTVGGYTLPCELCILESASGTGGLSLENQNNVTITAQNAGIEINGSIGTSEWVASAGVTLSNQCATYSICIDKSNNTTLQDAASAIPYEIKIQNGYYVSGNPKTTITPTPITGSITDPRQPDWSTIYPSIPPYATYPSVYYGNYTASTATNLQPGVYNSITFSSGGTYSFKAGVYYIASGGINFTAGAGVTLNGLGVTLYFLCGTALATTPSTCAASGQAGGTVNDTSTNSVTVNLQAPAAGSQANILYLFDPHDSVTMITSNNFSGRSDGLDGAFYGPMVNLVIGGNSGNAAANAMASPIVCGAMLIGGNSINLLGQPIVAGSPDRLVQ
jgi:hypothetical protein